MGLALVAAAYVLDNMFAEDPPPPPPMGWAEFITNAQGQLGVQTHDANALGAGILNPKMAEILASLNKQLAEANGPRIESGMTNPVTPGADPGSMHAQALAAAQAKVDAAYKALIAHSTLHPLGLMSEDADARVNALRKFNTVFEQRRCPLVVRQRNLRQRGASRARS
jgi:hypothetical protein